MNEHSKHSGIVVDGLLVSQLTRDLFEQMQRGGLTLAHYTCSIWENFEATMQRIASCKKLIEDNSDLVMQVYSVDDIVLAKQSNRVGIALGWQNTAGIEDKLQYLRLFHELGIRIMQLTYNTQNYIGAGCYETFDGGLSDFGKEAVDEMNRLGILVDLSHCGPRTGSEAINYSKTPVCFTHVAPSVLKSHPRCKTDEQIVEIARRGGFIGVTPFPPLLPQGIESNVDDFVLILEHVINIAGEERVGIGSDFSQGDMGPIDYYIRDKGYARKLVEFGQLIYPEGFRTCEDYPSLSLAMDRRGWSETRIERVMGTNWVRFLGEVWVK